MEISDVVDRVIDDVMFDEFVVVIYYEFKRNRVFKDGFFEYYKEYNMYGRNYLSYVMRTPKDMIEFIEWMYENVWVDGRLNRNVRRYIYGLVVEKLRTGGKYEMMEWYWK